MENYDNLNTEKPGSAEFAGNAESRQAIEAQMREVKLRLRAAMNGPVSTKMREMGVNYRLNFGVELPRLRDIAEELPHNRQLAVALWKEDIRECRHLATMLMPVSDFEEDLAALWIEQLRYVEEAESLVMNLLQHAPYASTYIFRLIASNHQMTRLAGWLLTARLFMQGLRPSIPDTDEILDHLEAELKGEDQILRQAAYRALLKFMALDAAAEARADRLLRGLGL